MQFSNRPKDWRRRFALVSLFAVLTFLYMSPGCQAVFQGRTDQVLSDDTDPATLPYVNDLIFQEWKKSPSHLFYGSVYVDKHSPDGGLSIWAPWNERFINVFLSYFLPTEQVSVGLIGVLLMLNGLFMYLLCRYIGWNRTIAIALGIAWAFNAYTRGRAKVHGALSGIYHLPLVFLALLLIVKGKTWRSLLAATALLLLAVSVAQYYVVMTAFFAPLLLLFAYFQLPEGESVKRLALRLSVATLPAVLFLAFNLAKPVPSDAALSAADAKPKTGETRAGEIHPFLTIFAARAIDYFAGDVAIGSVDWNPLRAAISNHILSNLDQSNPHERANSVRWLVIALAAIAIGFAYQNRASIAKQDLRWIVFFAVFGFFSLWLSLGPNVPFPKAGPAYWLYSFVSQIRVPSRASTMVHFSLLMLAGWYVHHLTTRRLTPPLMKGKAKKSNSEGGAPAWQRWLILPGVFPLLIVADLPPLLQSMPMAPIRPAYSKLQRSNTGGECGAGMYFPFVAHNWQLREQYHFIQQMRQSDCILLNYTVKPERMEWLIRRFGLHPTIIDAINRNDPRISQALATLVQCVPLTWLVFDSRVSPSWRENFCRQLGWTMHSDLSCTAPALNIPMRRMPETCL